ncbi:hypothetical protein ACFOLJ_03165 [Rugamonas sp. CCM 8940]|uniref:hypothetical protein n=1 Tax=Rugamonas sp. CCM 8940 TaxID=2765359 RepID=UPI0018F65C00|nr:hypothetical protein [Rugamonas sp. CCM 8940]MBJ7311940.1 hypothetical protein [Rugamonas sp. CCM 8940]
MHAKKNPARQDASVKPNLSKGVWRGPALAAWQARQTLDGGEWGAEADTVIMPRRRGLPRKG